MQQLYIHANTITPIYIIVAVAENPQKQTLLSLQQRINLVNEVTKDIEAIDVRTLDKLVVDFARDQSASVILRGLRNSSDFKYEKGIAQMNRSMKKNIETIFIITEPEVSHISSTLVRDVVKNGGNVSQFVPDGVTI